MFGSSDKPVEDDGDAYQANDFGDLGDIANAARSQPQRQESGRAAGHLPWLPNRRRPDPAASDAAGGGGGFRNFYNNTIRGGAKEEQKYDEELAVLDEDDYVGGGNHRRSRAAPSAAVGASRPRPSSEGGTADHADAKAKFKAIVRKTMAASRIEKAEAARREKAEAARRGRERKRQEEQELGDFSGYIQVQDPALNTDCDEYRDTANLAEAKYR